MVVLDELFKCKALSSLVAYKLKLLVDVVDHGLDLSRSGNVGFSRRIGTLDKLLNFS